MKKLISIFILVLLGSTVLEAQIEFKAPNRPMVTLPENSVRKSVDNYKKKDHTESKSVIRYEYRLNPLTQNISVIENNSGNQVQYLYYDGILDKYNIYDTREGNYNYVGEIRKDWLFGENNIIVETIE